MHSADDTSQASAAGAGRQGHPRPLCLLLGAATRVAAFALAGTMAFAVVEKWPLGLLALASALTYLVICSALMITGAGAAALDARWEPRAPAWLDRRVRRATGSGSR